MIVRDEIFVSLEVLCISLTLLVSLTVFLCSLVRRNFTLHDHNALIGCGLSLLGTVTLFLVLSETNPHTVCTPLLFSHPFICIANTPSLPFALFPNRPHHSHQFSLVKMSNTIHLQAIMRHTNHLRKFRQ